MKSKISKTLIATTLAGAGLCNSGCETLAVANTGFVAAMYGIAKMDNELNGSQQNQNLPPVIYEITYTNGAVKYCKEARIVNNGTCVLYKDLNGHSYLASRNNIVSVKQRIHQDYR